MTRGRLEAFSDGCIAIIITIMVLELKSPEEGTWASLRTLVPTFLAYTLSFVHVGIYWNNHHHLFQAVERVNGRVLWANLHLIFWLSLVPFVTSWMGNSGFERTPVIAYGVVLLLAAIAYFLMAQALLANHATDSAMARAISDGRKERLSLAIYVLAIGGAFLHPGVACAGYGVVAVLWLIPDRRIEAALTKADVKG